MIRSGDKYLIDLDDGRYVSVAGERVESVAADPTLSQAARAVAFFYDRRSDDSRCVGLASGFPIGLEHIVPACAAEVSSRHDSFVANAAAFGGLAGRMPDYLSAMLAGFAGRSDVFAAYGNEEGAARLRAYQRWVAEADLCLTHAVIGAGLDAGTSAALPESSTAGLRVTGRERQGIHVTGARVVATLAPFADEVLVYPKGRVDPGAADRALMFAVDLASPGVRIACRTPMPWDVTVDTGPLDEQDAVLMFEDVFVPAERVFIDGNVDVYNYAARQDWHRNHGHQALVRATEKLRFLWAVATELAEVVGARSDRVFEGLGELWCHAELADAAIHRAVEQASAVAPDVWFPASEPLRALKTMVPPWLDRAELLLRRLGRHALMEGLTGAGGASRPQQVTRLAWALCGSSWAGRGALFEMFHGGSRERNLETAGRTASRNEARARVDHFLACWAPYAPAHDAQGKANVCR